MNVKTSLLFAAMLWPLILCVSGRTVALAKPGQWSEAVPLTEINTDYHDKAPFLSFDGLTLYFDIMDGPGLHYARIYQATRPEPFGPFTSVEEISTLNYSGGHVSYPWVSPDNLRMYYYRTEDKRRIKLSERASINDPWQPGINVRQLNALGGIANPSLTPDELTIVFTGTSVPGGQGGYDIWMATRSSRNEPFGNMTNLTEINSPATDVHPSISSDGLSLYFASDRNGIYQLFKATRESLNAPFSAPEHLSFFDLPESYVAYPSLSSDGTALFFVRRPDNGMADIYVSYISEVPESKTYYIDMIHGNDLNNGLSPETALATIQKGIDAAQDGDTILVYPGVYIEKICFKGKAITLQGVATAVGVPILEMPDDLAISFYYGEGPDSTLKNFVITNSLMGIFIVGSSPTISNLTVVDNEIGIMAAGAEPYISNCIFWNNTDGDLLGCQAHYSWVQQDIESEPLEGLISHWMFDEGQGSIAYDSVGDHHGTIYGAQWTSGKFGGALSFDGINDYVDVPEPIRIDLGTSYTVSVWIKTNIISSNYGIIAAYRHQINPSVLFQLDHYGADARFVVRDESANIATATYSNAITTDTWCHVVGVRKEDILNVYVNGVKGIQSSNTFGQIIPNDLKIGAIDCCLLGMHHYFNGAIDEVMVFGRALYDRDIQQLCLNGSILAPLFADPHSSDYHLKSERGRYWPLHDVWVLDKVTSPCIDGGDPASDYSNEPKPNGGRINMGAYGGTPHASMSEWPLSGDINHDGVVNMIDFMLPAENWLQTTWSE